MKSDDINEMAIQAALQGNWEEAIGLNLSLLNQDDSNIEALNRLGHAYIKLSQFTKAKTTYKKVLNIDRFNPIAKRNIKNIKSKASTPNIPQILSSSPSPTVISNFLEEPGKTKTTQLVRLADLTTISSLNIGQKLILDPRKRAVAVKSTDNTYIGTLPDDLSFRLGKLIKAGNKYQAFIRSNQSNLVQIFIRETKKSKRAANILSFPAKTSQSYYSDIKHTLLDEEPIDVRETGQEDESSS